MAETLPLYNSRIIQTYLDYLRVAFPRQDIDEILEKSGITRDEVADTAHWFTQDQTDRFYEVVAARTGDENIARNAGRYSASSKGLNTVKRYVIGMMSIETALMSLAKIVSFLTRGSAITARKLSKGKIEIVSKPHPNVAEKPYQCENRLGCIEAVPRLFSSYYAQIEHPVCFHKGHEYCQYIISWEKPPSLGLKRLRNYVILSSLLAAAGLFFLLPMPAWGLAGSGLLCLNLVLSLIHSLQKSKELERIIEDNQHLAEEQIGDAKTQYNNSLLVQEIGQATAAILNIDDLMNKLVLLMGNRLGFDRGLILLTDESGSRLSFSAGYGYSDQERELLRRTRFSLDNPESQGIFVRAFVDQKHIVIDDIDEVLNTFSSKSQRLAVDLKVKSILCVPILYENQSMGILAVDNKHSNTAFKKSDVNLMRGIASQIAISVTNARSFKKLQESENRYRQTLESISEGYFEIDAARRITLVNKALCSLLGYSADELAGTSFEPYFGTAGESVKTVEALLGQIWSSGKPVHFAQYEVVARDGRKVPVDLSASLIVENGQPTGLRGMLRDATDRLNLEMERQKLENQLLRAKKMEAIGTLAGGIAHNFNNWLTGILGNITLIRMDSQCSPKANERIQKIENIIENAAKMTQQLLGYARGGQFEVKPINLNQIVQESADTFGAAKKDIVISLDLDPLLGTVKADKSQIDQVFWNLYVNASDAMPNGGELIIKTCNKNSSDIQQGPYDIKPGRYVCVSVTDTGSGIAKEHLDSIFDPFFTTKSGRGTGLGLASVYGIVKAHSGYIDVKTHIGVGSTFTLYLPAVQQEISAVDGICYEMENGSETILLVDDETIILDTSNQLLSRLGYRVLTAVSGEEGLKVYKENMHDIHLVIIDMVMPRMSGGEFFTHLKAIDPNARTLLSSGYSMNDTARKIMDQGCNGFIQKPFDLIHLSHMIRKIIGDKQIQVETRLQRN